MTADLWIGLALTALVGVSLGLLGAGGSIIMVPVLVYVVGVDPHGAVPLSLLIVGATSLASVAAGPGGRGIHWRAALIFGSAALAGASVGSRLTSLVPGSILLLAFGLLLVLVGFRMWRQEPRRRTDRAGAQRPVLMIGAGSVVGVLTGFLGVGGGFLIVPALVRVGGLGMARAVRTSLVVIAMSSGAGLAAHLAQGATLPARLAVPLLLASLAGMAAGLRVGRHLRGEHLRRGFAGFVTAVGVVLVFVNTPAAWQVLG